MVDMAQAWVFIGPHHPHLSVLLGELLRLRGCGKAGRESHRAGSQLGARGELDVSAAAWRFHVQPFTSVGLFTRRDVYLKWISGLI